MKSVKRKLAAVLACAMAFSTASVVYADGSVAEGNAAGSDVEATVDMKVQGAIYSFQVPTSLSVGLDAFSAADDTGSQVYSPANVIINKSNVPLVVTVRAAVEPEDGTINVKDSASKVKVSDPNATTKDVYFEVVGMQGSVAMDSRTGAATFTEKADAKVTYDAQLGAKTNAKATLPAAGTAAAPETTLTNIKRSVAFALDKATYVKDTRTGADTFSALAANDKGTAAFRFMGSLNPNVQWADSSVKVRVIYDVNGMSSGMYTNLTGATAADVQKTNMIVYSPTVNETNSDLTFEIDDKTTPGTSVLTSGKAGTMVFDLGDAKDLEIKDIKVSYDAASPVTDQALSTEGTNTDYVWTAGTNTLELKDDGDNVANFKDATGDVTVKITFKSTSQKVMDFSGSNITTSDKEYTATVVLERTEKP